MQTKNQFAQYFKTEIEPTISASDKPALRQAWNDTIDGLCKAGTLPERARDWSHPDRFYTYNELLPIKLYRLKRKDTSRPAKERVNKYVRKTKDIYRLYWKGEEIDTAEDRNEKNYLVGEYNLAYGGGVTWRKSRERI